MTFSNRTSPRLTFRLGRWGSSASAIGVSSRSYIMRTPTAAVASWSCSFDSRRAGSAAINKAVMKAKNCPGVSPKDRLRQPAYITAAATATPPSVSINGFVSALIATILFDSFSTPSTPWFIRRCSRGSS